MTCQHCGAALPPFALFCGDCGRSVSAPVAAPPVTDRPVMPVTAPVESIPVEPTPVEPTPVESTPARDACRACGVVPEPDDQFCAQCGGPLASDTRIIEPLLGPAPAPAPVAVPEPEPAPVFEPFASVDDSTLLVPRASGGARFVLQFSTGESYTVLGGGLVGRNPRPEPGEYVDHLVTIVDPARSVSKTHLEFGQHAGVFWVSDRHSGNGTVIREPGVEPRVCEPGRRYPIQRGTRIDLGEQFMIVS